MWLFVPALLIGGGVAGWAVTHERPPAWVAEDRQRWDAALEQFSKTYASVARVSAAGTNEAAARALAQSIRLSRRNTLAGGTQPIPPAIRQALAGHFPDEVLDDVRWTLAGRRVDLGSALARWAVNEGAVTLDDVVVFSREQGSRSLALWAHELTHVVQYRELGVADFARLYTSNWRLLEERARINAGQILREIRANRADHQPNTAGPAGEPAPPPLDRVQQPPRRLP
jgi:hypothetical protein